MAESVLTNAFVKFASSDISSNVRSVSLTANGETVDITAMSDSYRARLAGLKNWSLEVEFNQDFANSALDSILFPLLGTSVAIEVRPDAGSVSTSNPKYTGSAFLESYNPLSGAVGEGAVTSVTLNGTGALTRATS